MLPKGSIFLCKLIYQQAGYKMKGENINSPYIKFLSKYIGNAYLLQQAFSEQISMDTWDADLYEQRINFDDIRYKIHVLGVEDWARGTWTWGFADKQANWPETAAVTGRKFQEFCLEHGCADLGADSVILTDSLTGLNLGFIAAAASDMYFLKNGSPAGLGYYHAPVNGDVSIGLLVEGLPESIFQKASANSVVEILNMLISGMTLDHQLLVASIFTKHCEKVESAEQEVKGYFNDGVLKIAFDTQGRIGNMSLRLEEKIN